MHIYLGLANGQPYWYRHTNLKLTEWEKTHLMRGYVNILFTKVTHMSRHTLIPGEDDSSSEEAHGHWCLSYNTYCMPLTVWLVPTWAEICLFLEKKAHPVRRHMDTDVCHKIYGRTYPYSWMKRSIWWIGTGECCYTLLLVQPSSGGVAHARAGTQQGLLAHRHTCWWDPQISNKL